MSKTRRQVMVVEIEAEGMMREASELYELAKQLRDKAYAFENKVVLKSNEASASNMEDAPE